MVGFEFHPDVYDFYDIKPNNTVRVGNNLTFEASGVSFTSDSVIFDFKPGTFNFNPAPFVDNANAHLFKYKLSAADFEAGVTVEQFNASDYRALDYAFKNDELFDSGYYMSKYVVPNGTNPFTSYTEDGYKLGIDPNGLFDVDYYFFNNPDVLNNGEEPLRHFALTGYTQDNLNRDPNALFDTSYYRSQNPDVVDEDANPLLHYIQFGYKEDFDSRDPNPLFDSSYYKSKNPDIVAADANPLQHYLEFGLDESRRNNPGGFNPNRDPSPFFDTSHYYDTYTDVRIASYELTSANALQHYLEFGPNGRFANENRNTHPLLESEDIAAFSTFINSNSEGFESVQNEINNTDNGIQISPGGNGTVEVAGALFAVPVIVKGLYYLAVAATGYFVADSFTRATFDEDIEYSNFGFARGEVEGVPYGGTQPFPEPQEGQITITTFPKNVNAEDIVNPANKDIFFTPLEPIEEISSPNVFPQRDEILDTLLDEPLVFPGTDEIPAGSYAYPSRVNGTWYQDFLNGEDKNIVISPPKESDSIREQAVRDSLSVNPALKSKTRGKYKGIGGNVGIADYNIGGKTGTIKAFAGDNTAFVNGIPVALDGFAPYVPEADRQLKTTIVGGFSREIDSEAKILEEILSNVYEPGDRGTIRLISTRPICNSCGPVIENFVEKVRASGGNITVEVIQIRLSQ